VSPSRHDAHRLAGGLIAAWRGITHHVVHPISGSVVLTAAAIEVFEWAHVAVEHLAHLMEMATGHAAG
jgi:hypothetical protein